MDVGDLFLFKENAYNSLQAYKNSKLANIMFTYELARQLNGTGVTVNAVDPGRLMYHRQTHGFGDFGPVANDLYNTMQMSVTLCYRDVYCSGDPGVGFNGVENYRRGIVKRTTE